MKKLLVVIASAVSLGLAADSAATKNAPDEQTRAANRERMLRTTGGIVTQKGEGRIVVVNCQDKLSESVIRARIENYAAVLKYNFELTNGSWSINSSKPEGAKIAVFVVNDSTMPMSLIAPESGWGVINTAFLDTEARFKREMTRVFCLTAGAARSNVRTSVMQNVTSAADLDKLGSDGFTMDMVQAIRGNLHELGVTPGRTTSYRRACQEGWAPTPTNEYQKAIWDKIHELPTDPIKIKYDPKAKQ